MTKNMGGRDRGARFTLAIVVAYLYYAGTTSGGLAILLGVIAAVFLATSVVGTCSLYSLVGLSTCPKSS